MSCSCNSSCTGSVWDSICQSLTNIGSWLTTISTNITSGFSGLHNIATPLYNTEVRADAAGVANRQTAVAGAAVQLGTAWRKVTIRHPVTNTQNATISVGGNTITMAPGDNDLEFDFTAERFLTRPALTIAADATEAGAIEVDHVNW